MNLVDDMLIYTIGVPFRASGGITYKGKHDEAETIRRYSKDPMVAMYRAGTHGFPKVTSIETAFKNNWILLVSMGITQGCYWFAWTTLVLDNDAGAFFTDCLTMWTMFVYFYKDEKSIQYSYV